MAEAKGSLTPSKAPPQAAHSRLLPPIPYQRLQDHPRGIPHGEHKLAGVRVWNVINRSDALDVRRTRGL